MLFFISYLFGFLCGIVLVAPFSIKNKENVYVNNFTEKDDEEKR